MVWYYQGIDIGEQIHGWLVDDVSITGVSSRRAARLSSRKTSARAAFTLTGPVSQSGTALSTTISNAPPGPYTVQFSDVAFYQTPLDQSNTLATAGTLTFAGNYTFIDANHNGISDAWEKYYFGSVSTNRTQFTDTDGMGCRIMASSLPGTTRPMPHPNLSFFSGQRSRATGSSNCNGRPFPAGFISSRP